MHRAMHSVPNDPPKGVFQMNQSTGLVTIIGGSGFVGRYIARRMAMEGWRVRVAVRRPNEALFVKPYGTVGQVEPVLCNIRDDASVRAVLTGADAVVNCVGTFDFGGKNNFDAVQAQGAGRVARIAADLGLTRMVQISAIGADANADSNYLRTKGEGEAAVLAAFPAAVILRPSVVFGAEDMFFNRFGAMARMTLILPLVGAETQFQPVYVDDIAQAAAKAVLGQSEPGVYELGGPERDSFRGLMKRMLHVVQRRRLIFGLPFWLGNVLATVFDMLQAVTGGLIPNPVITRDQVRALRQPNVVSDGARGLADLGIAPTSMEAVLPEYLWRYRVSGQYAAINASARNLKV
jgi:NADH dehydrogenase